MIVKQRLEIIRGDTQSFLIEVRDENGNLKNIANWTLSFTAKVSENDSDNNAVIKKDITIPSGTTGYAELILSPSDTANLSAGVYVYDIQLKDTSNNVYTIAIGDLVVYADITRR